MWKKIMRRSVALFMVLGMLVVPGVLTGADGSQERDKNSDQMIAAWDTVKESVDADGNKVVDFLKGEILIRREVHKADIIEVYGLDENGDLVMTGSMDPNPPVDPGTIEETYEKYQDDKGRTILDTFLNGILFTREVYDPTNGEHVVTVYDKDGNPTDSKTWTDSDVVVDPPEYDDLKTYPNENDDKVADYIKDGVVFRREIYFQNGDFEAYELDADGNLVLVEASGSGSEPGSDGAADNTGTLPAIEPLVK